MRTSAHGLQDAGRRSRLMPLSNLPAFMAEDTELICDHLKAFYRPSAISFSDYRGPHFVHNQADFGPLTFHSIDYGSRAIIKSPPTQDMYLVVMPLFGRGCFYLGKHSFVARPGDIAVFNPSDSVEIELSKSFRQIAIQVPHQAIRENIHEQLGYVLETPLLFTSLVNARGKGADSLTAIIRLMVDDLNTDQILCSNRHAAQHAVNMVISLLLSQFESNYKDHLTHEKQGCRPKYVRRAEDHIRENYDAPISVKQLADAVGTTPRSLQLGFRKYLATTPSNYLKRLRLERARQMLTSPSLTPVNITHVALCCGFNHLSNFTKYYKEAFGKTPSQTLSGRRSQGKR